MSRGIVYILTNDCFKDDIIKIGITDNLERRIKELSRDTGVPTPFECHCAFEMDNYKEIEKVMHEAYRGLDLQTDKVNKKKEFFKVLPEVVERLLRRIAVLHNGVEVFVNEAKAYTEDEISYIEKEEKKKVASNFKFENYGIEKGAELVFFPDEVKKCKVADNNKVEYKGALYTLSGLTRDIFAERTGNKKNYNGYAYWMYDGEILTEIRKKYETSESEITEE